MGSIFVPIPSAPLILEDSKQEEKFIADYVTKAQSYKVVDKDTFPGEVTHLIKASALLEIYNSAGFIE